jgi:hypothetical protein
MNTENGFTIVRVQNLGIDGKYETIAQISQADSEIYMRTVQGPEFTAEVASLRAEEKPHLTVLLPGNRFGLPPLRVVPVWPIGEAVDPNLS